MEIPDEGANVAGTVWLSVPFLGVLEAGNVVLRGE
jgi:hypothetical protein